MKRESCHVGRSVAVAVILCRILILGTNAHAQEHTMNMNGNVEVPVKQSATPENMPTGTDSTNAETKLHMGNIGKDWPPPVEDTMHFASLRFDQLEYRLGKNADILRWDATGWYGGDYNRFWLKTEGDWETTNNGAGEVEVQALYGRFIARYWDLQLGLRHDYLSGPGSDRSRTFAVFGLQGLAPYRFEFEPALYISQDGDLSGRLTASYDLWLTQRLILQPRADIDAALQSVDEFGVGKGLNSIALGLRLRYEITREFAPYLGVHWLREFGETAASSRRAGESTDDVKFLFGLSIRF